MAEAQDSKRQVIIQLSLLVWAVFLIGFALAEVQYTLIHGWMRGYKPLLIYSHHQGPAIPGIAPLPAVALIIIKFNNALRLAVYAGLLVAPIFYLTHKVIYMFLGVTLLNLVAQALVLSHEAKLTRHISNDSAQVDS